MFKLSQLKKHCNHLLIIINIILTMIIIFYSIKIYKKRSTIKHEKNSYQAVSQVNRTSLTHDILLSHQAIEKIVHAYHTNISIISSADINTSTKESILTEIKKSKETLSKLKLEFIGSYNDGMNLINNISNLGFIWNNLNVKTINKSDIFIAGSVSVISVIDGKDHEVTYKTVNDTIKNYIQDESMQLKQPISLIFNNHKFIILPKTKKTLYEGDMIDNKYLIVKIGKNVIVKDTESNEIKQIIF